MRLLKVFYYEDFLVNTIEIMNKDNPVNIIIIFFNKKISFGSAPFKKLMKKPISIVRKRVISISPREVLNLTTLEIS